MVGGVKALYAILLALVLGVGCGKTSNEAANKLYVEAARLIAQAEDKENSDVKAAIADYERAFENIRKILNEHPESDLACLLSTSPSPRDRTRSRMPSSA